MALPRACSCPLEPWGFPVWRHSSGSVSGPQLEEPAPRGPDLHPWYPHYRWKNTQFCSWHPPSSVWVLRRLKQPLGAHHLPESRSEAAWGPRGSSAVTAGLAALCSECPSGAALSIAPFPPSEPVSGHTSPQNDSVVSLSCLHPVGPRKAGGHCLRRAGGCRDHAPVPPFPFVAPPGLRELLTEPTASPCGPPCLSPSPGVGQPGIAICGAICGVQGVRAHTEGLRPPVMKLSSRTAAPTPPPSPPPIRAPFCRPLPAVLWLEIPVREHEIGSTFVKGQGRARLRAATWPPCLARSPESCPAESACCRPGPARAVRISALAGRAAHGAPLAREQGVLLPRAVCSSPTQVLPCRACAPIQSCAVGLRAAWGQACRATRSARLCGAWPLHPPSRLELPVEPHLELGQF